MIAALQNSTRQRVAAQINIIAVPYNLAHSYFPAMQQASGQTPILHSVEANITDNASTTTD